MHYGIIKMVLLVSGDHVIFTQGKMEKESFLFIKEKKTGKVLEKHTV